MPTSSTNNPEIDDRIRELEHMHEVSEEEIDATACPMELFTHPNQIDYTELTNVHTTLDEQH